jgi:hypothetical protein
MTLPLLATALDRPRELGPLPEDICDQSFTGHSGQVAGKRGGCDHLLTIQ